MDIWNVIRRPSCVLCYGILYYINVCGILITSILQASARMFICMLVNMNKTIAKTKSPNTSTHPSISGWAPGVWGLQGEFCGASICPHTNAQALSFARCWTHINNGVTSKAQAININKIHTRAIERRVGVRARLYLCLRARVCICVLYIRVQACKRAARNCEFIGSTAGTTGARLRVRAVSGWLNLVRFQCTRTFFGGLTCWGWL